MTTVTQRKTNKQRKARNFCITSFTPEKYDEWKKIDPVASNIKYMVYQLEETKEGKHHVQGYIELKHRVSSFKHIKKILNDEKLHIETRKGTAGQARAYCMKEDSQIKPPVEHGNFKGQGTRSDIATLYHLVKEGKTPREIADIAPGAYMRYYKAVDRVYNQIQADKEGTYTPVEVHVLYGDAGAGKTRYVYDKHGVENVYRLTQGNGGNIWYDGYHGQDTLLIDDFYGWIKYSTLLQTIDNYKVRLSVKGGHTYSNWRQVYITSNKSPTEWYTQGLTEALERRIKTITHMKIEKTQVRSPVCKTITRNADGTITETKGIEDRKLMLVLPSTFGPETKEVRHGRGTTDKHPMEHKMRHLQSLKDAQGETDTENKRHETENKSMRTPKLCREMTICPMDTDTDTDEGATTDEMYAFLGIEPPIDTDSDRASYVVYAHDEGKHTCRAPMRG